MAGGGLGGGREGCGGPPTTLEPPQEASLHPGVEPKPSPD